MNKIVESPGSDGKQISADNKADDLKARPVVRQRDIEQVSTVGGQKQLKISL